MRATVTGSIAEPQIQLSSLPPLSPTELAVLVSTGAMPETVANRGMGGQAMVVGGYLMSELVDAISGSDRVPVIP